MLMVHLSALLPLPACHAAADKTPSLPLRSGDLRPHLLTAKRNLAT